MDESKSELKDLRSIFRELEGCKLSESQERFINGLKKYFKRNRTLSEKQIACLLEVRSCVTV